MVNLIFPVIDEFDKNADYIKSLKNPDYFVIVGVTEDGAKYFNFKKTGFKVKIFKQGSKKEEIINALQTELRKGSLIILRKRVDDEVIKNFANSKFDITVCDKKKTNKFCEFFVNLWKKVVRFLFDLAIFEGDVSVVAFSDKISDVVRNISNLSYASRINRWKGVDIGYVETNSKPAKKEYSRQKNFIMLFSWIFVLLAVIGSTVVYFYFKPATFLAVFLWICALLIASLCTIIAVIVFTITLKIGKRYFLKAQEVENVKN